MNQSRQSKLRTGRYSEPLGLYFVTKCVDDKKEMSESNRVRICDSFIHARSAGWLLLHAFVVMPDHWHILVSLGQSEELSLVIGKICRYANCNNKERIIWQSSYHDHKVRSGESIAEIVQYIENNPLRKAMVAQCDEWRWSSAHVDYAGVLDRAFLGHERWEGSSMRGSTPTGGARTL